MVDNVFKSVNSALPFSSVFPLVDNDGKENVTWTPNQPLELVDMVDFRGWDAEVGYGKSVSQTGEKLAPLMPLGKRMHVSERDIIGHVNDKSWLRERFSDYFGRLATEVAVRMEMLRVSALVNAKFDVNINGQKVPYDFGRDATLSGVKPTKNWGTKTSTPVDDIKAWRNLLVAVNGVLPEAVITTRKVMDTLATNAQIIQLATKTNETTMPTMVSDNDVRNVLESYCGLTEIRLIDEAYKSFQTTYAMRLPSFVNTLLPEGTFLMFSSFNDSALGATFVGPTGEAESAEYGLNKSVNTGLVGAVLSDTAPLRYDTYITGTMMPILVQSNNTFQASVLG
ncbi:hypothetical protein BCUN_1870 [Bifidobacterium cuniculi]|uniref:Major capsid protein E n=2 Tax=Bifidobacterium cuniculi TaxID=1688 RepID=A0A087AFH2_9BIFI|nr:hypothetical protein BCUN_1870 [Bifidobacterium cuniculi]